MNNYSIKRFLLPLIVLTASIAISYANDTPIISRNLGSTEIFTGNGNTEIRLDSERVTITLGKDSYKVDAVFWLFNEGPAITTEIGFPQKFIYRAAWGLVWFTGENKELLFDIDAIRKKQELGNFRTWINNKKTASFTRNGPIALSFFDRHGVSEYTITGEERDRLVSWINETYRKYKGIYRDGEDYEIALQNNYLKIADSIRYSFRTAGGELIAVSFREIRFQSFRTDSLFTGPDTVSFHRNKNDYHYLIGHDECKKMKEWIEKTQNIIDEMQKLGPDSEPRYTIHTAEGKALTFSLNYICNELLLTEMNWLTKKVTFPANGRTVSRVSYSCSYPMTFEPFGELRWNYIYGTGKNWKGNIKKAVFIENDPKKITNDIKPGVMEFFRDDIDRKPITKGMNSKKAEVIILDFEPEDKEYIEGYYNYDIEDITK